MLETASRKVCFFAACVVESIKFRQSRIGEFDAVGGSRKGQLRPRN